VLIDYALYNGQPAAVFVFTSEKAGTYDAFIVGMRCGTATDDILKFVRVDAPK